MNIQSTLASSLPFLFVPRRRRHHPLSLAGIQILCQLALGDLLPVQPIHERFSWAVSVEALEGQLYLEISPQERVAVTFGPCQSPALL